MKTVLVAFGDVCDVVDPFIGSAGLGHVTPAACAPFGDVAILPYVEGFSGATRPGENKYVKSVTLNGKSVTDWKIRHADIMAGGELTVELHR